MDHQRILAHDWEQFAAFLLRSLRFGDFSVVVRSAEVNDVGLQFQLSHHETHALQQRWRSASRWIGQHLRPEQVLLVPLAAMHLGDDVLADGVPGEVLHGGAGVRRWLEPFCQNARKAAHGPVERSELHNGVVQGDTASTFLDQLTE